MSPFSEEEARDWQPKAVGSVETWGDWSLPAVALPHLQIRESCAGEKRSFESLRQLEGERPAKRVRQQQAVADEVDWEKKRARLWHETVHGELFKFHKRAVFSFGARVRSYGRLMISLRSATKKPPLRSVQRIREVVPRAKALSKSMQMFWNRCGRPSIQREKLRKVAASDEEARLAVLAHEGEETADAQSQLEVLLSQAGLFTAAIQASLDPANLKKGKRGHGAIRRRYQGTMALEFMEEQQRIAEEFDARFRAYTGGKKRSRKLSVRKGDDDSVFKGTLKAYQSTGLQWLSSLWRQGLNGILADEMGLGKTVQAISFVAHLAQEHDLWGPFLIVAPNSVLHQWVHEFQKFAPELKVLPYWGSPKDRELLRTWWSKAHMYKRSSKWHVLVTSYSKYVTDEKFFKRLRSGWLFMVLDEAQAIKNSESQRWNALLSAKCRTRLLLSGTPVQNNLDELWSLLHFIMPRLFDSLDNFKNWFAKDVEGGASSEALQKLHALMKPFMLRRVKSDVADELSPKTEVMLRPPLAMRQRQLYASIRDGFLRRSASGQAQQLRNLLMQFRKVCNHPETFERRSVESPFLMHAAVHLTDGAKPSSATVLSTGSGGSTASVPLVTRVTPGAIDWSLPRALYHDGFDRVLHGFDGLAHVRSFRSVSGHYGQSLWSPRSLSDHVGDLTRVVALLRGLSAAEVAFCAHGNAAWRFLLEACVSQRHVSPRVAAYLVYPRWTRRVARYQVCRSVQHVTRQVATAMPVLPTISSLRWRRHVRDLQCDGFLQGLLWGHTVSSRCWTGVLAAQARFERRHVSPSLMLRHVPHSLRCLTEVSWGDLPSATVPATCAQARVWSQRRLLSQWLPPVQVYVPDFGALLADSGKLMLLDRLLGRLHKHGHRVLIFSQMTRMLDILEDFLRYRSFRYFRLDGSTPVDDRRDMVATFQRDPQYFVFLLSTHAGGLGITLTAADTVIFYDSDWNPTYDAQATDRVHRIGQTKPVTVYRLVSRDTVEERVLARAQEKLRMQTSVYTHMASNNITDILDTRELSQMLRSDGDSASSTDSAE